MTVALDETGFVELERPAPSEAADIEEIVRGIQAVQAQAAEKGHRPLARGTHTKGTALGGELEVLDVVGTAKDPGLARRLARGIFARPGKYPAVIRFANAASTHAQDRKRDVRALSFSIEVPPDATADGATRLDFAMNNATTFPFNDAHAFALAVRLIAAPTLRGRLRALRSMSWADLRTLGVTLWLGIRQQRDSPRGPYQRQRYWSTVPYRHGRDEAIKYSATPAEDNPARPLQGSTNAMQDELIRHVNEDEQMSTFDFSLQLLDAARMTYRGSLREPSFWIENASIEWNESEAPFHVVARLRLLPKSVLTPAAAEAVAIDVVEHSTPESRPIGSINRARWHGESASQRARLAQPTNATPWTPAPVRPMPVRLALGAAVLLLAGAIGWNLRSVPQVVPYQTPAGAGAASGVIHLDQGWDDNDRRQFYHWTQGSQLLPYKWFLALPQPSWRGGNPDKLFRDTDYLVAQFGFIADGRHEYNPDGLPIGIAKDVDPNGNEFFGLSCAACHTQQITYQGKVIRIDGGRANAEMNWFGDAMVYAVVTATYPTRFGAFADRVLGPNASTTDRLKLRWELTKVAAKYRLGVMLNNQLDLVPVEAGFGRLDALGKGGNNLFGSISLNPFVLFKNLDPANGNVAFPELWDAPTFDWAQYAGAIRQPMARNATEAMGVFARLDFRSSSDRFNTSVRVKDLHGIEQQLRKLTAPSWPEDIFGAIDRGKAERGKALYSEICARCHEFKETRDDNGRLTRLVNMVPFDTVGTDSTFATNFANRFVDTGDLGGGVLPAPQALQFISNKVLERKYREMQLEPQEIQAYNCCAPNEFRASFPDRVTGMPVAGIRPRPHNGVWTSGPYLHNGSVPTVFDLLGPAEDRPKTFMAGSLEYDPVKLGFRGGTWQFDTSLPGNSNRGHEFRGDGRKPGNGIVGRALSDTERYEIIEFLKTLRVPPTGLIPPAEVGKASTGSY